MSRLFGEAIQTGIIVPNVEEAMNGWLEAGIGPFFLSKEMPLTARYRGKPSDVVITVAFAYSGEMQYEFVQQDNDNPSAFGDFMAHHPQGGLHHLAYICDDIEETVSRVNANGPLFEVVQEFVFEDGKVHEIYMDPVRPVPGQLAVQLISRKNPPGIRFFELMKDASADWDGRDPIRSLDEMMQHA